MSKEVSIIQNWLRNGHSAVMAVVATTWGSAPRRPGSLMVVRDDGVFEGSVSGGCVEGSVIAESVSLMSSQTRPYSNKTLEFSVASDQAWEVGLACGGEITIFLFCLSAKDQTTISELGQNLKKRTSASLSLPLSDDTPKVITNKRAIRKPTPFKEGENFVIPFIPPVQLDIVGAVHIAQHLAVMAVECDFAVRVIDPRGAFSQSRSFGDAKLYSEWPDDFFQYNAPDTTTAVVTLTHDPKLDDVALQQTLRSDAFYIGCLGSRKTHASRVERLKEAGFTQAEIGRINAPIGLDIGSATPAEIATSILAEIIQSARKTL